MTLQVRNFNLRNLFEQHFHEIPYCAAGDLIRSLVPKYRHHLPILFHPALSSEVFHNWPDMKCEPRVGFLELVCFFGVPITNKLRARKTLLLDDNDDNDDDDAISFPVVADRYLWPETIYTS